MSISSQPLFPNTSNFGDLYMRGGIFREVALLNPVPSDAPGERNTRLGFFGVDGQTNTQHALCVIEPRAADNETRRAQLAIRVNRGNDGMEPPVDTLTLDGNGDLRLYNQASEQIFRVDTGGNVATRGDLSADSLTLNVESASGSLSTVLSASDAGIAYYDSQGGNFIIDGINQQIVTSYAFAATSFNGLNVTGDLAAENIVFDSTWRIVPIADMGLYVQKNIDGVWTNKMRIAE